MNRPENGYMPDDEAHPRNSMSPHRPVMRLLTDREPVEERSLEMRVYAIIKHGEGRYEGLDPVELAMDVSGWDRDRVMQAFNEEDERRKVVPRAPEKPAPPVDDRPAHIKKAEWRRQLLGET